MAGRIFGNMASKISQKPLKHVLSNFAPMLFNLFPIKLQGDFYTWFKSPYFACPIKILKKWEQKIFLISSSDFYTFDSYSLCLLSCHSCCSPAIDVEMDGCIENTHFEMYISCKSGYWNFIQFCSVKCFILIWGLSM